MNRYEGLENDVSWIRYNRVRDYVVEKLTDDDSKLDLHYLSFLLELIKEHRKTLDEIKEFRNGRQTEDSDTEVRRSNNTCNC